MRISIVVPTYRGAARVERLLVSIADHGTDVHEVMIADDGSPQADRDALEDVADIARLQAAEVPVRVVGWRRKCGAPQGWTSAVSAGMARTSGDAVLLLDDDALMPPGLLLVLRQLLGLAGIGVLSWRSLGDRPGQSQVARPGFLQPATQLAGFCMAFRRTLWDELGGLDGRFRVYCADSDLALRATLAGRPSYRVWWPLVPHLEHRAFEEAPELGDRQAVAAADLAAFQKKWGATGPEMEARALVTLAEGT